jgi:hypothetical protein
MDELYKLLQTYSEDGNLVISKLEEYQTKGNDPEGIKLTKTLDNIPNTFLYSFQDAWDYYNKNSIYLRTYPKIKFSKMSADANFKKAR